MKRVSIRYDLYSVGIDRDMSLYDRTLETISGRDAVAHNWGDGASSFFWELRELMVDKLSDGPLGQLEGLEQTLKIKP